MVLPQTLLFFHHAQFQILPKKKCNGILVKDANQKLFDEVEAGISRNQSMTLAKTDGPAPNDLADAPP